MKFKIDTIVSEDEKRIIYIKFDNMTEFTNEVRKEMANQITNQIFNNKDLMKQFFITDEKREFLEYLEEVGEYEKDNEYIDLSDIEVFDTMDFENDDIYNIMNRVHIAFIRLCLNEDFFDPDDNIDFENKTITFFV